MKIMFLFAVVFFFKQNPQKDLKILAFICIHIQDFQENLKIWKF